MLHADRVRRTLEVRKIEHSGMMRWKRGRIFTSKTLPGELVDLEEINDGIWSLYYGPVLLARFRRTGDEVLRMIATTATCHKSTTRRERITYGIALHGRVHSGRRAT